MNLSIPGISVSSARQVSPNEILITYTICSKTKQESFVFQSDEKAANWLAVMLRVNNTDVLKDEVDPANSCGGAIMDAPYKDDSPVQHISDIQIQDLKAANIDTCLNQSVVDDRKRESAVRRIMSSIRTQQIKEQSSAFHCLMRHSLLVVQTEALTAAESLAGMNEEFLERLDLVPLRIGLKHVVSLVERGHFKLKLTALDRLNRRA